MNDHRPVWIACLVFALLILMNPLAPIITQASPQTQAITTYYFAEGCIGEGFYEFICLVNPGGQEIKVRLYAYSDGPLMEKNYEVPSRSRLTLYINNECSTARDFSIKVESEFFFVAERSMYFNYNNVWPGGHCVMGASSPSQEWYFAEGYTGEGFDEYICVFNPGSDPAKLTLRFLTPMGEIVKGGLVALPQSRTTFNAKDLLGSGYENSLKIESSRPVVAERPMYFDYRNKWPGGHCVVGSASPSTSWYFAEGYTGADFDSWLCLAGLGTSPTDVIIDFLFPYPTPPKTIICQVGPMSRCTLNINEAVGKDKEVAIRITASEPIVAERPMYFKSNDFLGGHCVMGASSTSNVWYLAEGYTGGGFRSWLLVAGLGTSPTKALITYMFPDGTTMEQDLLMEVDSRETVSINSAVGEGQNVAIKVEAAGPIVVERSTYFIYQGLLTGGHCAMGCMQ